MRYESFCELGCDSAAKAGRRRILFSHHGGIVDGCDDWSRLDPADRNAAFATAVDYALAHRDQMMAAGLDMDLFTALHG